MLRVLGWLFVAFLVIAGVWGYYFLEDAGAFLNIPEKQAGVCKPVSAGGVVGVEDLTIDGEKRIAYLAGYDRRSVFAKKSVRGAIWAYALDGDNVVPVDVTSNALPGGFHPHGISLFRGADGKRTLFVINHANHKHAIEIFDVDGINLTHRRTVEGPELVSPNDIVGVGADSFYVTNDHANTSGWMRTVEDFGRLRLSKVMFFDGQKFSIALENLGGSNGINVSADGASVYVSAASERAVHVYDRNVQTQALTERAVVRVPGFADNIEVLENGDLLLGLHSKIFPFLDHVQDANKHSPSHIMYLEANGTRGFAPHTIYYNFGAEISGASVGAASGDRLLIGAIFEPKFLDCTWSVSH